MSVQTFRWSGWLLLIGAVVYIVGSLLGLDVELGPVATNTLLAFLVVGAILVMVGLPAFYRKQAKQVGRLGLCGFIALLLADVVLGIVANIYFAVGSAAASSAGSAQPSPLFLVIVLGGAVLGLIGGLLFGVTTIRAHIFPAAIGWLLIVAGVLSLTFVLPLPDGMTMIVGTITQVVLFLAFGWMGYCLALRTTEATAPSPA
jgi:hypothetical protein